MQSVRNRLIGVHEMLDRFWFSYVRKKVAFTQYAIDYFYDVLTKASFNYDQKSNALFVIKYSSSNTYLKT